MPTVIWPTGSATRPAISDGYGMRWIEDSYEMHNGADVIGTRGRQWVAPVTGTVIASEWSDVYGWVCVIETIIAGARVQFQSSHNLAGTIPGLGPIRQGDGWGQCGLTGYTFGYHNHFAIYVNGNWRKLAGSVNPETYIPAINTATAGNHPTPFPNPKATRNEDDMIFRRNGETGECGLFNMATGDEQIVSPQTDPNGLTSASWYDIFFRSYTDGSRNWEADESPSLSQYNWDALRAQCARVNRPAK